MKRVRVVLVNEPTRGKPPVALMGTKCRIEDADTGEAISPLQDFTLDIPFEGVITVDAKMIVAEITME